MKKENPYDEKFINPNKTFEEVTKELRVRITNLELDLINISDPELKGIAQKMHSDLIVKYFKIMRDDLALQVLYGDVEEEEE